MAVAASHEPVATASTDHHDISSPLDDHRRRLAEHKAGRGRRVGCETRGRKTVEHGGQGDPCLQAGEVHADADVRPGGEGKVATDVRPVEQEPIGLGELGGVPVGAGERDDDVIAPFDRRAGDRDITCRVAVDERCSGLEPQRLLDGGRSMGVVHRARRTRVAEDEPQAR